MKKLFVVFTVLTVLAACFSSVSYADAAANYFEPVYNADNWTVNDSEKFTFDNTAKSVITSGTDVKTATYKDKGLTGDVILTFDAKFGGSSDSNHNKIALGSMVFDFMGDGTFSLTKGTDNIAGAVNNGFIKNTKGNSIVIVYKNAGEVVVYDVTDTEQKAVYSYNGSLLADANDGTFGIEDRYAGSITVSNIKMYKPQNSFFDDFESNEDLSAKWDLYIPDSTANRGYIKTIPEGETNTYMSVVASYNPKNIASVKEVFTNGSYTISTYFKSANSNKQSIYFNKLSDSAYYALQIAQNSDKKYSLDIMKNTKSLKHFDGDVNLSKIDSFKIEYISENGTINVYVNDETTPKLTATDNSYKMGKVAVRLANSRIDNFKIAPISAAAPEFSIGEISMSGTVESNSTVTGSAAAINTTDEGKSAVIIMAIYKNGEIAEVKKTDCVFEANCGEKPISISHTFGEIDIADRYKVKCFVFSSLDNIIPLTQAAAIPAEA